MPGALEAAWVALGAKAVPDTAFTARIAVGAVGSAHGALILPVAINAAQEAILGPIDQQLGAGRGGKGHDEASREAGKCKAHGGPPLNQAMLV